MGEKDTLTKQFMSRPDVFADAFNYLIYDGEPVIQPGDLRELDPTSISVSDAGDGKHSVQKVRDVVKEWVCMTDEKATYLILGVENQSHIHYAMPVRNMLYDAIRYDTQVKRTNRSDRPSANDESGEYLSHFGKRNKLKPVITLVIYFGDKEWDAPTSLYEMFDDIDPRISRFAADYKINLICPLTMDPEKLLHLTSEFKEAMLFLNASNDEEKMSKLMGKGGNFRKISRDTAFMLKAVAGVEFPINEREEQVDMCVAIQSMMDKSERKGIVIGIAEGRIEGAIEILRSLNLSDDVIKDKIQSQFALSDEEAAAYLEKVKK